MRRLISVSLAALLAGGSMVAARASHDGVAETIPPSAPIGFVVNPEAAVAAPTSLSFSPDGSQLFVTSYGIDQVSVFPIIAGKVAGPSQTFAEVSSPLGVLATSQGVFVSANGPDTVTYSGHAYLQGRVYRLRDTNGDSIADVQETVLSGLPTDRHNTNNLAIGPDGLLYVTNGSATDSGFPGEGGSGEVQPYSGSVLRVQPTATSLSADPSMVVATGMRNVWDIAFAPSGHPAAGMAFVPMNGPDGQTYRGITRPEGEDTLNEFDVANQSVEHFGFPWCLYDRNKGDLQGFTQDASQGSCDPLPAKAFNGLPAGSGVQAKPAALFGMHVSADGIAFNPGTNFLSSYNNDLFVTEWGNLFGSTSTGHKIVRVSFDGSGTVSSVTDFMTSGLPLDITFAPDGSMWVADFAGLIYRVASPL